MLGPGFAEKLAGDLAEDENASLPSDAMMRTFRLDSAEEEVAVAAAEVEDTGANTSFDTSFNFGFRFWTERRDLHDCAGECYGFRCSAWDRCGELQSVCAGGVEEVCWYDDGESSRDQDGGREASVS